VRSRTPYRVVAGAVASDAEARDDVVGALACPGACVDGIARRRRASRVAPSARVVLAAVGVGARAHGVGVGAIVRVAQCGKTARHVRMARAAASKSRAASRAASSATAGGFAGYVRVASRRARVDDCSRARVRVDDDDDDG